MKTETNEYPGNQNVDINQPRLDINNLPNLVSKISESFNIGNELNKKVFIDILNKSNYSSEEANKLLESTETIAKVKDFNVRKLGWNEVTYLTNINNLNTDIINLSKKETLTPQESLLIDYSTKLAQNLKNEKNVITLLGEGSLKTFYGKSLLWIMNIFNLNLNFNVTIYGLNPPPLGGLATRIEIVI